MKRREFFAATGAYSLVQIVSWGFFAVNLVFASNVLYDFGYTDSQISIFLGICTGISFPLQLALAELSAGRKTCSMWKMLLGLSLVMLVSNGLTLVPGLPGWAAVTAYGGACLTLQMLPSFANAMGMDAISRGSPTNYSIARGMGSLGYSVLAWLTGVLVRRGGTDMVPLIGSLCSLLMGAGVIFYHRTGEQNLIPVEKPRETQRKNGSFLKKYPKFALFLGAGILIQYAHNLPSNFMYQIMLTKNGGAAEQGLATAICALVELPVMFFFPLLMRRLRCDRWVRFSALFVTVKAAGILLAGSPQGVYLAQATQSLGYGLFVISSVNYAELVVGRGESVRAQTYLGATATVGCLLAGSTGGFLCQHLGVQAMVLISLVLSLAGGLLILFTAEKTKRL